MALLLSSEGEWWGWHVEKTRKQSLGPLGEGGLGVGGQVIVINFRRVEKDSERSLLLTKRGGLAARSKCDLWWIQWH